MSDDKKLLNFAYHRATIWNPIKKRNEFKTFNSTKYSEEQMKEKAKEWKLEKKKELSKELTEEEELIEKIKQILNNV